MITLRIEKIYHLALEELYVAVDDYVHVSPDDSDSKADERYTIFREFVTDFLENIARDVIEQELGDSIIFTLTFQGKVRQSPLHSIPVVYNVDAPHTREQLVTMLWRYAGSPAVNYDLSRYSDSHSVSDWAKTAMAWAVEQGLIQGSGNNLLTPDALATREQVATILTRFVMTEQPF